jgi:hypothetical protein
MVQECSEKERNVVDVWEWCLEKNLEGGNLQLKELFQEGFEWDR